MDERAATEAFEAALKSHRPAFEDFFLSKLLGLRFAYDEGKCIVSFEAKDFMFNPQGSLHGGVIATVMDISMGHLLNHVQGPGTTLEMKTQYVKAARTGTLTCTGEFIQQGQGISYLRSTLVDNDGDVVAFATATWKRLKQTDTSKPQET
ncbi:PaaI family thioesterase [Ramlibacter albus]|uniref:PaaI family thioesterase n=1 Tax=Ramlibacter albus TaxID=2079448 RepID=A0A923S5C4_9BURK|nr:PaaI family thioesterase [Ramlibacter albus]MBC5767828.1 PaaI family thioesterase [Ramlibacter albus]